MKPAPEGWGNVPTRIEPAGAEVLEVADDVSEFVGRQIGNYVIERMLARGGMAVVYLAKHPGLGREVAVKLLSAEYSADADLNRRFLQEARVTAGFRHENIVEIYDLGEVEGRAYYTMERLVGFDLSHQLSKKGSFSPGEMVAYFSQICAALIVAHEVGVVHRDLKPANIFVVSEDPLHVKLMDFGIAKITEGRPSGGTRRGEVLGTPAYMAPEQALGNIDAISVTTDIYALGIIAYEMLTGRLPFSADSDMLLLTMQIRDQATPIRELVPSTPPALAELIERCLAKEPGERPQSVKELLAGMRRAIEDRGPPAAPPRAATPTPVTGGKRELVPVTPGAGSAARRLPSAVAAKAPPAPPATHVTRGKTPADVAPALDVAERTATPDPFVPMRPERPPSTKSSSLLSEITDEPPMSAGSGTLSADDGKVLDKLLRRMQRRADFPSFLNNVTEISRKADADADFSAWQLSESILKDFALTAKLLRMVNSLFGARFNGKVFSVKQAVVILGFDSVRSMALGVSVYKLSGQKKDAGAANPEKQNRFHEDLADETINSLVSGEIARTLAPKAGIKDTELAMMCAMFRNLGQQLVMEYLPEEYQKILALAEAERIPRSAATQRVLGTTLPKIGLGVAERWCLPKLMRAAMASNVRGDTPLVREEDRLGALAKLSNDLCHIIASGDRQNYKTLIVRLLATHRRLLVLQEQDISSLLGTVCKSFESRYSALYGPYHRKSRFLFHAQAITRQQRHVESSQAEPLTEDEHRKIEDSVASLSDGLQRKVASDTLLAQALPVLSAILGAPRVLLLTTTSDRKELEVRAAFGEDAKALKAQFKLPITNGAEVFSSALRNGKNVVIDDALGPAAVRRLPQRYFEAIGSASFALYVCASRGYPTCLLFVDSNAPESLPSRERALASKPLRELVAKIAERR
jgi:HD-like signal output (HDOD) protein